MLDTGVVRPWRGAALAIILGMLAGCYEFDSDSEPAGDGLAADHELTGSVGDGPISGAAVQVIARDGTVLGNVSSDSAAGYNVTVRTKGEHYPLTIDARDGVDLVTGLAPDFALASAVLEPRNRSVANINPFTTVAVELAAELAGGLTSSNLNTALAIVTEALNSGLNGLAAGGVLDLTIDVSNIAEIVKASETLGEAIRRTRDALASAGRPVTGDTVVRAIASDLVDSVIDGRGGAHVNGRLAAVFSLASAQVSVEAMSNRLRVNGALAAQAMDDAIRTVLSAASPPSTNDVPLSGAMLAQALTGLAAAQALNPSNELAQLETAVAALHPGMLPSQVAAALVDGASSSLDNPILAVASGSTADVEKVNAAVRDGGEPPAANTPPSISGTPPTVVAEGAPYDFTPTVSDPDAGETLAFNVTNLPVWASFNTATGRLFGTPQAGDAGSYGDIVIGVSDGESSDSLPAFTINVEAVVVNTPPSISGNPPITATEGVAYDFTPAVNDPDAGTVLTFDVANQPGWASFNTATGRLFGTPQPGDAGSYGNIVIRVSDGEASDSLPAFTITVEAVAPDNTPPRISGNPPITATEGVAYDFTPTVSDPDAGDTLTFDVSNLPGWASFDTATGRLFGTPQPGDAGSYSNIVISVNDGSASDSLPAFTITVEAVSMGSATLSWTAPTQNTDGSALTDLAGFRVYWTRLPNSAGTPITLNNPGLTTYVVENLAAGTYEFTLRAFDQSGNESVDSNVATKTIQ